MPAAKVAQDLLKLYEEIDSLSNLLDDKDKEVVELAKQEKVTLSQKVEKLERTLGEFFNPPAREDALNIILEIRAGTGGAEASLFVGDLFRMYHRYADLQGWKVDILSAADSEQGGYKEILANVSGKNVFSFMKFEAGVHRVQRVPETESSGRIHTSAATVAILPEPEQVTVEIEDKDLRIDVYRSSGPGGQSVNTTDSAVRITHVPTGIVVTQQDEKSQHKNKAKAIKILRARLYDHERQKVTQERASSRKQQVGSGDRSERIRTYNFPQGRVTDHRINLTLYKLERILLGDGLQEVLDPLRDEQKKQNF